MSDKDTLNAILRTNLTFFIQKAFSELNPNGIFLPNWHIQAIAWHLTLCLERRITRLIITLPPRNLKSISASVAFIAWALGLDPTLRFICVSYAEALSNKHAFDTRRVMESDFYKDCFPGTRIDKATQSEIVTMDNGFRLATTVTGSLTGLGGDFIIVDDLHKADEVNSDTKREAGIEFFTNTLLSRLDDKKRGVIIVVQQRLHENDLVGHLLESGGWEHLNLPAIAEEPQKISIGPDQTHVRKTGDVLHPNHEPLHILEQTKADMGELKFAAQYQQRPAPLGGAVIKLGWFQTYHELPDRRLGGFIVQSWDTAYTVNVNSDWSVCTTWLVFGSSYYLVDVFREKLEFTAVEEAVYILADRWRADVVVVEAVGAGEALCQRLKRAKKLDIAHAKPQHDKTTRMLSETPTIADGKVFLPAAADWLENFQREMVNFPNGKHDDQVDSLWLFLFAARYRFRGSSFRARGLC